MIDIILKMCQGVIDVTKHISAESHFYLQLSSSESTHLNKVGPQLIEIWIGIVVLHGSMHWAVISRVASILNNLNHSNNLEVALLSVMSQSIAIKQDLWATSNNDFVLA